MHYLQKTEDLLATIDEKQLKLNAIMLKIESLEKNQKKTAQDVSELKDRYKLLDHNVTKIKSTHAHKANRKDRHPQQKNW